MIETNKIFNESNLDTLARMPNGYLDMTLSSPPYDDLRVYSGYSFEIEKVIPELFRVTKDGGIVVWVINDRTVNGDETGTSFRHALLFKEVGFKLWDTMLYAKNNPMPSDPGKRYQNAFEYMFCFVKGEPHTFNPITVQTSNPGKSFDQFRLERDGRN